MGKDIKPNFKEATVSKRALILVLAVVAIVAMTAIPAFAGGYNNPTQYKRSTGYFSGPHGGYTTTTNKCADCHATHYATGSYMLLRANSREAACDYCHGGGGGSTINIQMDNDYNAGAYTMAQASAITTTTSGYGTGHTLGFTGNAPADINPAYSDANGFACFDCHTPHGNSARVMTTFANPGRVMGTGAAVVLPTDPMYKGGTSASTDGVLDAAGEWGIDGTHGNIKVFSGGVAAAKPVFPTGRFLLLKNPHQEAVADDVVSDTADNGQNKIAIDWDDPLGPADGLYGGEQDLDGETLATNAFYDNITGMPTGTGTFLGLSEFCTDCHDGTGGASTQSANVWNPDKSGGAGYEVVYSHDVQPRH
jgi:hypothetical protein